MNTLSNAFAHKALAAFVATAMTIQAGAWAVPAYASAPVASSDDIQLVSGVVALESSAAAATLKDGSAADASQEHGSAAETSDAPANVVVDAITKPDVVSERVAIGTGTAGAVLVQDGLTYQVTDEAARTVTLTGWTGEAPAGELAVPEKVGNAANPYTVTNIGSYINLGGGVRAFFSAT